MQIGTPEAIKTAVSTLMQALQNQDAGVRQSAVWALGNIGEDAVPALIPLLQDQYEWVRVASAQALKEDRYF